jgi:hypothetical protein
MRFRLPDGEDEHDLIRIREDHLLNVTGIPGGASECPGPWLDVLDHRFGIWQACQPHPIANRHDIGGPALALQLATEGGDHDVGFIANNDLVPETVRPCDPARHCIGRGLWLKRLPASLNQVSGIRTAEVALTCSMW